MLLLPRLWLLLVLRWLLVLRPALVLRLLLVPLPPRRRCLGQRCCAAACRRRQVGRPRRQMG
jgi:hypothetical protein